MQTRTHPSTLILAVILAHVLTGPVRGQQPEPRPLFIEGYTGQSSYLPGEEIDFHISTSAGYSA